MRSGGLDGDAATPPSPSATTCPPAATYFKNRQDRSLTGVPMRTLMEWMGHASISTTEIYADYSPSAHEAEWVNQAFGEGNDGGNELSETESTSAQLSDPDRA
jgi:hypothetical protein